MCNDLWVIYTTIQTPQSQIQLRQYMLCREISCEFVFNLHTRLTDWHRLLMDRRSNRQSEKCQQANMVQVSGVYKLIGDQGAASHTTQRSTHDYSRRPEKIRYWIHLLRVRKTSASGLRTSFNMFNFNTWHNEPWDGNITVISLVLKTLCILHLCFIRASRCRIVPIAQETNCVMWIDLFYSYNKMWLSVFNCSYEASALCVSVDGSGATLPPSDRIIQEPTHRREGEEPSSYQRGAQRLWIC